MALVCVLHGKGDPRPLRPAALDESRIKGVICLWRSEKVGLASFRSCVTLDNQSEEITISYQGSKAWPHKASI